MTNRRVVLRSRPAARPDAGQLRVSRCAGPGARRRARCSSATSTSRWSRRSARDSTAARRTCRRSGPASRSRVPRSAVWSVRTIADYRRGPAPVRLQRLGRLRRLQRGHAAARSGEPEEGMPLSYYVGALGGSGHHGLRRPAQIGGIQAGETVVVSAAAGGVGSVAGQIATPARLPRRRPRRLAGEGRADHRTARLRRGDQLPRDGRPRRRGGGGLPGRRRPLLRQRRGRDARRDAAQHEDVWAASSPAG